MRIMKNRILYTITAALALASLFSGCCKQLENKLLEPKSYFENSFVPLEVRDEVSLEYILKTRISTPIEEEVGIDYSFGDSSDIEEYNKRHGTEYLPFPLENASFNETKTNIPSGGIYSLDTKVTLKGLDKVEAGKVFLLPIHFEPNGSASPIASGQTMFLALQKPIQIKNVGHFDLSSWWSQGDWISLPRLTDETFQSVTYEALIYSNGWGSNNTVMGVEGKLIFRIGDEGGGLARNKIQIAGNKQFHYDTGLTAKKWYHVAFTFNHETGKANIYINGKSVISSDWDQIADMREGFAIGQVPHFMWGTRPFNGYMSEVRLWNVARSENEIQQNMLNVDPKSKGLVVYYKLNGDDIQNVDGVWKVIDATSHGYDGIPNDGNRELKTYQLPTPLEAKDIK